MAGLLALAVSATACGHSSSANPSTGGTLSVALPSFGAETALPWNMTGADINMWVQTLYDTLATTTPGAARVTPSPALATSWDHSADLLTWTFKLRQGVQFHKGNGELTANDVVYTVNQSLVPTTTGSVAVAIRADVKSVSAPDKYTVVFNLTHPNSFFIWDVTNSVPIVSQAYLTKVGPQQANKEPIGTGPWVFDSSVPGISYTFTADAQHWRQVAHFRKLVLDNIPDPSTAMSALRAGTVDIVGVSGDAINQAKSAGFRILQKKNVVPEWVALEGVNTIDPAQSCPTCPWIGNQSDPMSAANALKVRQAMAYAINKQEIIKSIWAGYGTLDAYGYAIMPGFPGWSSKWTPLPYDVKKAKQLLAEAGYPNGFSIDMIEGPINSDSLAVSQAVVQYWQAVGIKVNLNQVTELGLTTAIRRGSGKTFVYSPPGGAFTPGLAPQLASPKAAFHLVAVLPDSAALTQQIVTTADNASLIQKLGDDEVGGEWGIRLGIRDATWAISNRVGDWSINTLFSNYAYVTPK